MIYSLTIDYKSLHIAAKDTGAHGSATTTDDAATADDAAERRNDDANVRRRDDPNGSWTGDDDARPCSHHANNAFTAGKIIKHATISQTSGNRRGRTQK